MANTTKRVLVTLFLLLVANVSVFAVKKGNPEPTIHALIYPKGQNCSQAIVSNGLEGEPKMVNDWGDVGNIGDGAWYDVYLPKSGAKKMVVVCPGGGYAYCSSINEGEFVARWFLEKGVATCVVNYRLPNGHPGVPLTDIQNVFRYLRANASKWGVEEIGIIGFSAGGHLAATATNLWVDEITRPDFSILVYPVVTMYDEATHKGTKHYLLGDNPSKGMVDYYSIENQVTSATPRSLILLSANDNAVPPVNSLNYFKRLVECGVNAEMHIFPEGGHGWGFTCNRYYPGQDRLGDKYRAQFFEIIENWLLK